MSTILELLPKWTEMTTVTQLCSTTFPKWKRTSMRWTKTSLTSKNMPRNHSLFSETESQKSQISIWYRTSTQKVMLKVANQYLLSNKALSKTFFNKSRKSDDHSYYSKNNNFRSYISQNDNILSMKKVGTNSFKPMVMARSQRDISNRPKYLITAKHKPAVPISIQRPKLQYLNNN